MGERTREPGRMDRRAAQPAPLSFWFGVPAWRKSWRRAQRGVTTRGHGRAEAQRQESAPSFTSGCATRGDKAPKSLSSGTTEA